VKRPQSRTTSDRVALLPDGFRPRCPVRRLLRLLSDRQAVTAVEYAVMLGMIVLLLLGSVALLGESGNGLWTSIHTNLNESTVLK